ncbi:MAG: ammonia-forming cytochrome c nitrite reductase subunit c552 [Candidatus Thiodiazotropha sp. (ex Lucinoma borealis)]|nr:ammonia-forming cytochrome c nitrite reductase subunit c552 [Candidatus Thiodiazotropha sp. (ex Lucinoma borealis)]MCU7868020.1 ammonia-forming cytochrome c nitrite reductase subunit c552 [Candidatus Thiodiazotropha sp. (ex Lucinoma borealis)]
MNLSLLRRLLCLALICCHPILFAAKVTVDPNQWGDPLGKECISCHEKASPGLAQQWHKSVHAEAGVNCLDCHKASVEDDDAITHEGQVIATIVSPLDCSRCHTVEYEQQKGSVHSEAATIIENRLPALAGHVGGDAIIAAGCDQCHGSKVKLHGDGTIDPSTWPNSGIGRINPDGSKGSCSSCHGKHRFSKAQAREPSACVRCHSGPDSPDKAIYEASKHGMQFQSHRDEMALSSDSWVAGKDYVAAPTCVTCHMGAAGKLKATHDVGMRNVWSLNTPISQRQQLVVFEDGDKMELPESHPSPRRGSELTKSDGSMGKVKAVATPKRRRQAMNLVCLECHSKSFASSFMKQFDGVVKLFNEKFGKPAKGIMQALYSEGVLTPVPFDEPIEFTYWELWHDEGARARHGAAMASANHTWWEGMYLVGRNFYARFLPQVEMVAGKEMAKALIEEHVKSLDHHKWMDKPQKASPILGYDVTRQDNE